MRKYICDYKGCVERPQKGKKYCKEHGEIIDREKMDAWNETNAHTPGLGAFDRDWSGVNIERKKR